MATDAMKRIIPCLDLKDGRVVKGVKFGNLRDAADPVEAAKNYEAQGADEIVLLDISATNEGRATTMDVVKAVAEAVSMPITVGGGIRTVDDMRRVLNAGATKVSVNSAAVINPMLVSEAATELGSEKIVVAIDIKEILGSAWTVLINGGNTDSGLNAIEWAEEMERNGAGEILLTSFDRDGMKNGYDIKATKAVAEAVSIPVIASGGAGKLEDFYDVIVEAGAEGVLAASLFHFGEVKIPELKSYLESKGIEVNK